MPDQNGEDETAGLVGAIMQSYRERYTADDEHARQPLTYDEVLTGDIAEQMARYGELADRDSMATAIAILKARGDYEPSEHVNEVRFPPLAVAEHLELLALGERIAGYYRHPSQVDKAARAGATWDQIAAATGTTAEDARAAYRAWAEGQHQLHADTGLGLLGLDDAGCAAALELAERED